MHKEKFMSPAPTSTTNAFDLEIAIKGVLGFIEREREREIIARRFGLYDRRETLEQIGELLGITRERVRQLEKAVMTKLKSASLSGNIPQVISFEKNILPILSQNSHVMKISDLASLTSKSDDKIEQSRIFFLSVLSPNISVIEESDLFYSTIGTHSANDEKKIRELSNKIVGVVKKIGKPITVKEMSQNLSNADVNYVTVLAGISKLLTELNNKWGLIKWPLVNPKNIRDKIYVILSEQGNHMHFSEIAEAIKQSDFKRKNVTTQAIHNELIKDNRFILVGRGIYALEEWGYKKGTVADMITEVLQEADKPLHKDEIVKRVLKSRHVKETTILLNLQGKPQFKRTNKATYTLV
jgi:hypothetical protein